MIVNVASYTASPAGIIVVGMIVVPDANVSKTIAIICGRAVSVNVARNIAYGAERMTVAAT